MLSYATANLSNFSHSTAVHVPPPSPVASSNPLTLPWSLPFPPSGTRPPRSTSWDSVKCANACTPSSSAGLEACHQRFVKKASLGARSRESASEWIESLEYAKPALKKALLASRAAGGDFLAANKLAEEASLALSTR